LAVESEPASRRLNPEAKALRHGIWALTGKLLNTFGAIAVTAALARLAAPSEFSRFVIARTGLGATSILAAFGIGTATLWKSSQGHGNEAYRRQTIQVSIRAAAGTLLAAGLLAGLSFWWFAGLWGAKNANLPLAVVIGVATILLGAVQICADFSRSMDDLATANLLGGMHGSPLLNVLFFLIVLCAAATLDLDSQNLLILYTFVIAITLVVGIQRLFRRWHLGSQDSSAASAQVEGVLESTFHAHKFSKVEILSTAWPIALTSLLVTLSSQCDILLCSLFSDPSTAPLYVAARRVVILLAIPSSIAYTTATGIIGPMYVSGERIRLQQILRSGSTLVAVPTLAMSFVMMCIPEMTLRVVLGEGYQEAAPLLRVLVFGQVMVCLTGNSGALMSLTGHGRKSLWVNLVAAVLQFTVGAFIAFTYGALSLTVFATVLVTMKSIAVTQWALAATGINTWVDLRMTSIVFAQLKRYSRRLFSQTH
jgi:O-antigen/teichoic acid export membrane protein